METKVGSFYNYDIVIRNWTKANNSDIVVV